MNWVNLKTLRIKNKHLFVIFDAALVSNSCETVAFWILVSKLPDACDLLPGGLLLRQARRKARDGGEQEAAQSRRGHFPAVCSLQQTNRHRLRRYQQVTKESFRSLKICDHDKSVTNPNW